MTCMTVLSFQNNCNHTKQDKIIKMTIKLYKQQYLLFIEEIHSISKSSETKNFQLYSKLIHFINWPVDSNLKILKDLENFN